MSLVAIGVRRLYDALGVDTSNAGAINLRAAFLDGEEVSLYLGPTPPLGVVSLEGGQFGVPGRSIQILRTDTKYESPCFLEICVAFNREVDAYELERLKSADKGLRDLLLSEGAKKGQEFEHLLDAICGVLGLQVHRQLVLKPLIEHAFLSGDFDSVSSYVGPFAEMLEPIEANANTSPHIANLLEEISKRSSDAIKEAGAVLHWLLKAWRERDPIARFMYLFIPLEAVLKGTDDIQTDLVRDLEEIAGIVQTSDAANKERFVEAIERIRTRLTPTLNARFEEFARRASIAGWELDVAAFKRFNRMRNLLLHSGRKDVRSHIDFEENSRTLEDLVERYVSIAVLGMNDVYPSRWRPTR